jgi:hypothetical protein
MFKPVDHTSKRIHANFFQTVIVGAVCLTVLASAGCSSLTGSYAASDATVVRPVQPALWKTPAGEPAVQGEFYEGQVPADTFTEQGTLTLWFRCDRDVNRDAFEQTLIDSNLMKVRLFSRGSAIYILTDSGPLTTGVNDQGNKRLYKYQTLFTHLKQGEWYFAAWTWDARNADRNDFLLDGISQGGPGQYHYPGQLTAAREPARMRVGGPGLTVGPLRIYQRILSEQTLADIHDSSGNDRYDTEGVRFPGTRFIPNDVAWSQPVYETDFTSQDELDHWILEGGFEKRITNGRLILDNGPDPQNPTSDAAHLVCWLKKEMPGDFLLEFTVRPKDRNQGLAIVFFNARGVNGESIFDPSLSPRTGSFRQYTSGDINSYHASYWSGGRETTNLRKNVGFYLAAIGKDLVTPAGADAFQQIRIYKRGARVRITVDDIEVLRFEDTARIPGPPHTHSGWIGLRQMRHAGYCEYDHFAVYPLTDPNQ